MKTTFASQIEPLEARIAPAALIGLDNNNHLLIFDSATPGTVSATKTVEGVTDGETLIGIDFRPATGGLYGVTLDALGTARVYLLDPATGMATFSALLVADPADSTAQYTNLTGANFGMDFNPVVDRLRLVSDTGVSLRIDVDTGFVATDDNINPGGALVAGAAYTNAFAGSSGTTLYDLDMSGDVLAIQNPSTGTLTEVGALGVQADGVGGFDILSTRTATGSVTNTAYAALKVGGVLGLYTVNLTTGAAALVGGVGNGGTDLRGLTAQIEVPTANAYTVDATNHLLRFNTGTPGMTTDVGALTGLGGGEAVVGLDFRAANGALYVLTKDGTNVGRVYSLNVTTGAATLAATLGTALEGTNFGVDFNPMADRLRIVSDLGQNLRVNLDTGLTFVDVALNGAGTAGMHAAYTNSVPGAAATTLFGIDTTTDLLVIQNPPNNGTLTLVGSLGVDASAVGGFDIRPNGDAYATLSVGGVAGLYRINLGSGAATLIGQVGALSSVAGLAIAPSGVLGLSTTAVEVAEDGGPVQFTINRTGGSDGAISVVVSTGGGTAVAGTDYTGFSRVFTLAPGVLSQSFVVNITGDAANEPNELFGVALNGVTGSQLLNGSNEAMVTILNDDPTSVTARMVTYTDGDGDLVTLKVSKGTLTPLLVNFEPSGKSGGVQLAGLDLSAAQFLNANVTATAKRVATRGDSFANVGYINAIGNLLGTVSIDGDLGQIDAASVKTLTVQSIGRLGLTTQAAGGSLVSNLTGSLNTLTVKSDMRGASIVAVGNIGAVNIGGNLTGTGGDYSGSLEAGGKIASVKILGSLQGGTGAFSGSIIAKTVGAVNIRGELDGGHIVLSGNVGATKAATALALTSLTVGGNVENSRILVGYSRIGEAMNADVTTGAIKVTGDWVASNLAAGVRAGSDGAFGTDDDKLIAPVAGLAAKIASIAVRGQVLGTTTSDTDRFGFAAEEIGSFMVGKAKFTMSKAGQEDFEIGPTDDVRLRETIVAV